MKKSLIIPSLLLSTSLFISVPNQADASFKDVQADTEQGIAIQSLVDRGIVSGYQDGTFHPRDAVTRGQIAKILTGALKLDIENVTNPNFSDVPTTHPNYKYIAALANAGIVSGSNGNYNPNQPVTRGQVAKMLSNAYKLSASDEYVEYLPFTDVKNTGFEKYVTSLYQYGITTGVNETTYGVNQSVTRGQLAVFIKRIEEIRPYGSTLFLAKDYGIEGTFSAVPFTNTNEPPVAEIFYTYYDEYQVVKPLKPGTSYLNLVEYNGSEDYESESKAVTIRVDVTEGKNGLETKLTKLNEELYPPQQIYFNGLPEKVVITDLNNNEIDPSLYFPYVEDFGYGYIETSYKFLGDEGEYLLHATDEYGNVETFAFKSEKHHIYNEISLGYYIPGNSYEISREILESTGYHFDHAEYHTYLEDNTVEVEENDNGITLKIYGEAEGELNLFTDGDEQYDYIWIQIKKFADGYLVIPYFVNNY